MAFKLVSRWSMVFRGFGMHRSCAVDKGESYQ